MLSPLLTFFLVGQWNPHIRARVTLQVGQVDRFMLSADGPRFEEMGLWLACR